MPAACMFCRDASVREVRSLPCCDECAALLEADRLDELADRALAVPGASGRLDELRELFRRLDDA